MVNFWNQRRIANPSHLLLSGRGRSRPAGSIGLCGGSYCRRVSSVCDRQPTLDCQSSGRGSVTYTVASRQLQTSLHCSRLLRIFAAGIEVWCNGSTTDFGYYRFWFCLPRFESWYLNRKSPAIRPDFSYSFELPERVCEQGIANTLQRRIFSNVKPTAANKRWFLLP